MERSRDSETRSGRSTTSRRRRSEWRGRMRFRPPFIAAFVALAWAPNAAAYRPFDSTDASVAEAGRLEVELGPLGYLAEGQEHFLVAPILIANLGLSRRWELVLQGRHGNCGVLLSTSPQFRQNCRTGGSSWPRRQSP